MGQLSSGSEREPFEDTDGLLAQQQAYYRALAPEYEKHALYAPGGDELLAALDRLAPHGDVLELACGPGSWTAQLLRHAAAVTAIDGSAEMLEIASARVIDPRVRFVPPAPDRREPVHDRQGPARAGGPATANRRARLGRHRDRDIRTVLLGDRRAARNRRAARTRRAAQKRRAAQGTHDRAD